MARLKSIQVTYMNLGIGNVYGIIELLSKGVYQGEYPGTCGKVYTPPESKRTVTTSSNLDISSIETSVKKQKEV